MRKSKIKYQKSKLRNSVHCSPRPRSAKRGGLFTVHGCRGFTLVELMIAITITVLAMAAVYTTFIVQQRSFTTQDQVAETEVFKNCL